MQLIPVPQEVQIAIVFVIGVIFVILIAFISLIATLSRRIDRIRNDLNTEIIVLAGVIDVLKMIRGIKKEDDRD